MLQHHALKAVVFSLFVVAPVWVSANQASQASVTIKPLGTNTASGTLTMASVADGVEVKGELTGLPKNATLGFHVHEKGDCSAADGSSAGGHFNPAQHEHGALKAPNSHVGDLGNITTDKNGTAKISVTKKSATLGSGANSYVGKAVIVHAKADDLKSQPSGDAGSRIGCGVIEAKK